MLGLMLFILYLGILISWNLKWNLKCNLLLNRMYGMESVY